MKYRIREIRRTNGLSQRELAEKAGGMSVSDLAEIELGTRQINASRMGKIADALGVMPQDLIDG